MKSLQQIKEDLSNHGWKWTPKDIDFLQRIWVKMDTYFNDGEEVQSLMWAWFTRDELPLIGIVAVTSSRTFTIEVPVANHEANLRYVPVDTYGVDKIQIQPPVSGDGFTYISILNNTYNSKITFKTPSLPMARHFLAALGGRIDAEIEELPPSDDEPSDKPKQIEVPSVKLDTKITSKPKPINEDDKKLKDQSNWKNVQENPEIKQIKIKPVKKYKYKENKRKKNSKYATKENSYLWLLWFLIPLVCIIVVITVLVVAF